MNINDALIETKKYFHYISFKSIKFDGEKIIYTTNYNNPNENYNLIDNYFKCCLTNTQNKSKAERARLKRSVDSVLHWCNRKSFGMAMAIFENCIVNIDNLLDNDDISNNDINTINEFVLGMNSWYEI